MGIRAPEKNVVLLWELRTQDNKALIQQPYPTVLHHSILQGSHPKFLTNLSCQWGKEWLKPLNPIWLAKRVQLYLPMS
jgi:hypothetical protein